MRLTRRHLLVLLAALLLGAWFLLQPDTAAAICKWVDENGVTHFAEVCPDDADAEEIVLDPEPTQEQVHAAQERSAASRARLDRDDAGATPDGSYQSLPLEALGPLPDNTRSEYLETISTGVGIDAGGRGDRIGRFSLRVRGTGSLPAGALVDVAFPDPADPSRTNAVAKTLPRSRATLNFESPSSTDFRCWNYRVVATVYRDDTRQETLGTHEQTIQSHFDLPLLTEHPERIGGLMQGGVCPGDSDRDLSGRSLAELEALCEAAREKRLAPEREQLVKSCIGEGKDRGYCERFYANYGDPQRISINLVRRALYYDLPECLAWQEAGGEVP